MLRATTMLVARLQRRCTCQQKLYVMQVPTKIDSRALDLAEKERVPLHLSVYLAVKYEVSLLA